MDPDEIVFAKSTCVVNDPSTGTPVTLRVGDCWAADDPLCVARPDLFDRNPEWIHRTIPKANQPAKVETATNRAGDGRRGRGR